MLLSPACVGPEAAGSGGQRDHFWGGGARTGAAPGAEATSGARQGPPLGQEPGCFWWRGAASGPGTPLGQGLLGGSCSSVLCCRNQSSAQLQPGELLGDWGGSMSRPVPGGSSARLLLRAVTLLTPGNACPTQPLSRQKWGRSGKCLPSPYWPLGGDGVLPISLTLQPCPPGRHPQSKGRGDRGARACLQVAEGSGCGGDSHTCRGAPAARCWRCSRIPASPGLPQCHHPWCTGTQGPLAIRASFTAHPLSPWPSNLPRLEPSAFFLPHGASVPKAQETASDTEQLSQKVHMPHPSSSHNASLRCL